ncbi:MAG: hypothetical protein M3361_00330, partial [Candidatus Tectomicrobia bacterium]|nr:hypothetical protein [Candidatus Tectomicrobia bacterium]
DVAVKRQIRRVHPESAAAKSDDLPPYVWHLFIPRVTLIRLFRPPWERIGKRQTTSTHDFMIEIIKRISGEGPSA